MRATLLATDSQAPPPSPPTSSLVTVSPLCLECPCCSEAHPLPPEDPSSRGESGREVHARFSSVPLPAYKWSWSSLTWRYRCPFSPSSSRPPPFHQRSTSEEMKIQVHSRRPRVAWFLSYSLSRACAHKIGGSASASASADLAAWAAQADINAIKDSVVQGTKKVRYPLPCVILRSLGLVFVQLTNMASDFFNSMDNWS